MTKILILMILVLFCFPCPKHSKVYLVKTDETIGSSQADLNTEGQPGSDYHADFNSEVFSSKNLKKNSVFKKNLDYKLDSEKNDDQAQYTEVLLPDKITRQ